MFFLELILNRLVVTLALCGSLTACTSNPKETIFDISGSTMAEMFSIEKPASGMIGMSDGDLSSFTRTADRELEQLFPELPNPRLVMYVFPHLTEEGAPIPGYATSFYLYDKARVFAIPGEVAPQ